MSEKPAHITFEDAMKLARIALEMGYRAGVDGEPMSRAMHRLMVGETDPNERVDLSRDHLPPELSK